VAQRPTPKPLRHTCPFCNARIAEEISVCPNCKKAFQFSKIDVIKQVISENPSLAIDSPDSNEKLMLAVSDYEDKKALEAKQKAEEEIRIAEEEIRKAEIALAQRERELEAKRELRLQELAKKPKFVQLVVIHWKKISIVTVLLFAIVSASLAVAANLEEKKKNAEIASLKEKDRQAIQSAYALSNYMSKILAESPDTGKILIAPYQSKLAGFYSDFYSKHKESKCGYVFRNEFFYFFNDRVPNASSGEEYGANAMFPWFMSDLAEYGDLCSKRKYE
jgi:hypothetical protein